MRVFFGFCLILITLFASSEGYGQTRVTGHISAEVVECISLHSDFNNAIQLTDESNSVILGSIIMGGLNNQAIDIYAGTTLSNNIEAFRLRTDISSEIVKDINDISFSALLDQQLGNGIYDGRLTVILSFN